jgi:CheY-like chemotaxis protein
MVLGEWVRKTRLNPCLTVNFLMNALPILLVEDNPMDVDLTRRAFFRHNLANPLEVARDGQEAVDYIARWNVGDPLPAVILLDLKLPKLSGLEVLRAIRAHRRFSVVEAYSLGANSYIVKPVDFDKFIDVARQIELYWTVLNIRCSPKPE